jgi:hypothetical protein
MTSHEKINLYPSRKSNQGRSAWATQAHLLFIREINQRLKYTYDKLYVYIR